MCINPNTMQPGDDEGLSFVTKQRDMTDILLNK